MIGLVSALLGFASVALAQDGPAGTCSGDVAAFGTAFFGTEDNGNRLLSTSPTNRTYELATVIPAGSYAVNAVSYDGYSTRESIPSQPQEQWFAELLDAEGGVLATTGPTADLEDLVVEASWSGSVGSIEIAGDATSIRVLHLAPGSPSVNSVRPVCLGFVSDGSGGGDGGDGGDDMSTSIVVDYENTDGESVPVEVACGRGLVDSAAGSTVTVAIADVPSGATCEVDYTDGDDNCDVSVSDNAVKTEFDGNVLVITMPDSGQVVVDISCGSAGGDNGDGDSGDGDNGDGDNGDGDDGQTVTTTPATTTTTTTTVAPEVKGTSETADPVDADPSFTG